MSLAEAPSAEAVLSRGQIHDRLAIVAGMRSAFQSTLAAGVSSHCFEKSLSISDIKTLLDSTVGFQENCFLGVKNGHLVFSLDYESNVNDGDDVDEGPNRKKRRLDTGVASEDEVDLIVCKLAGKVDASVLAVTRKVVARLLAIRGSLGERSVTEVELKKQDDRVTLRARASGAVGAAAIVKISGNRDGCVTLNDGGTGGGGFSLFVTV